MHKLYSFLRQIQIDRTWNSHFDHPKCRCLDHPIVSIINIASSRRSNTTSNTTSTHQRLLSFLGRLCSLCIIHCIYVGSFPSPSRRLNTVLTSSRRLEAFARICVTGFLFDPDYLIFSSQIPSKSELYTPNVAMSPGVARQTTLSQGRSMTWLQRLQRTLMRPFVLDKRPPVSAYPMTTVGISSAANTHIHREGGMTTQIANAAHHIHTIIREPSEPTLLSLAMRSDNRAAHPDLIALPFHLSIGHLHHKTHRNVPYLRQSWSRIDFVAIVSFWISFILAMTGVERGTYHIGIFRAMSVIRIARLLTITSGTTVSAALIQYGLR